MRLTWRDGVATICVGVAVTIYALWTAGIALETWSATAVGGLVFVLGWAGCISDQPEMAVVYGVAKLRRPPPLAYVVTMSAFGALALITGIATVLLNSELALGVLVVSVVALWLSATVRHAVQRPTHLDRVSRHATTQAVVRRDVRDHAAQPGR